MTSADTDSEAAESGEAADGGSSSASGGDEATDTGGGEPYADPFASGTRLKARVWDDDNGVQYLVGWHDTELEADCIVVTLVGGEIRCIPASTYTARQYSDPGCTEPVHIPAHCADPASPLQYLVSRELEATCERSEPEHLVWELGDPLPDGPMYLQTDEGCAQRSESSPRVRLFPADVSPFAILRPQIVSRNDQLGVQVLVGDDGSYQWDSAVDLERDEECGGWHQDPARMCVPRSLVSLREHIHDDPACAGPGVVSDNSEGELCEPSVIVLDGVIHDVGEELDPAALFVESNDNCSPLIEEPGKVHRLGPVAMDGTFPAIEFGETGNGRLRRTFLQTPPGQGLSRQARWDFVDSEYGPCFPTMSRQGRRCIPLGPTVDVGRWWTEPTCSGQELHAERDAEAPDLAFGRIRTDMECGSVVDTVVPLGPAYTGPVYQRDPGDNSCAPYDRDDLVFFVQQQPLDPSEFVELHERIID